MQRRQIGKGPRKRFFGLLLESLEDRHLPSGVANLIVQPPAAADSWSSTPPVASPIAQAAPSSSGASQTSASAQNQTNSYFPTTQPADNTPWTAPASPAAQNPSTSSSGTSQQNQGPYAPGSSTTNPRSTTSNPGSGASTPTSRDPMPTETNGNVYSGQTYYPRPSPDYQQPVINLDSTPSRSNAISPQGGGGNSEATPVLPRVPSAPPSDAPVVQAQSKTADEHPRVSPHPSPREDPREMLFLALAEHRPQVEVVDIEPQAQVGESELASKLSEVDLSDLPPKAEDVIAGVLPLDTSAFQQTLAKILDGADSVMAEIGAMGTASSVGYWFAGLGTMTLAVELTRRLERQQKDLLSAAMVRSGLTSTWLPGRNDS